MIAIATTIAVCSLVTVIVDAIGIYPAPGGPDFKTLPAD